MNVANKMYKNLSNIVLPSPNIRLKPCYARFFLVYPLNIIYLTNNLSKILIPVIGVGFLLIVTHATELRILTVLLAN